MILFTNRRKREFIIVTTMIRMYCKRNHATRLVPCADCQDLISYANARLEKCKFGDEKPVCKDCTVHCYSKDQREKMKNVMKWSGPRMLYLHPVYALVHLWDSRS